MEDTVGCKIDEYTHAEEMFKPRKRRVSEFKTLPWAKQMYTIERYIQSGMYPYFMVGSSFRSTCRDFRWMVKDHYIVDKEQQVLRKLVNIQKQENGKFQHECEILTFSLPYRLILKTVQ